jgi:hypothetical protein
MSCNSNYDCDPEYGLINCDTCGTCGGTCDAPCRNDICGCNDNDGCGCNVVNGIVYEIGRDDCGTCGGSCDVCDCGCNVTYDACGGCNGYSDCDCNVGGCRIIAGFPCPSQGGCSCQDPTACDQDAFGNCLSYDACGTCDGPYDDCDCGVPNCISGQYFGCAANGGCGCQDGNACGQDAFGSCLYVNWDGSCTSTISSNPNPNTGCGDPMACGKDYYGRCAYSDPFTGACGGSTGGCSGGPFSNSTLGYQNGWWTCYNSCGVGGFNVGDCVGSLCDCGCSGYGIDICGNCSTCTGNECDCGCSGYSSDDCGECHVDGEGCRTGCCSGFCDSTSVTDYFGNNCCSDTIGTDILGNSLCNGYGPYCTDATACDEDGTGCLYHACNGNCISRTPTLYPNCPQPSVNPTLLMAYKLGILPIPSNNAALKNKLLAEINNFPLILQARASVSYQDGLYGKRYDLYFPFNGGANAFGTLARSTSNYPPHGDEEATVDFSHFSSSPDDVQYEYYSWQWLGYFKAPYTDTFTFSLVSDDYSQMWIGELAVSGFNDTNKFTYQFNSNSVSLIGGQYYPIRIQFGEFGGADYITLSYSSSTESNVTNFQGKFYHKTQQDFIAANPI